MPAELSSASCAAESQALKAQPVRGIGTFAAFTREGSRRGATATAGCMAGRGDRRAKKVSGAARSGETPLTSPYAVT